VVIESSPVTSVFGLQSPCFELDVQPHPELLEIVLQRLELHPQVSRDGDASSRVNDFLTAVAAVTTAISLCRYFGRPSLSHESPCRCISLGRIWCQPRVREPSSPEAPRRTKRYRSIETTTRAGGIAAPSLVEGFGCGRPNGHACQVPATPRQTTRSALPAVRPTLIARCDRDARHERRRQRREGDKTWRTGHPEPSPSAQGECNQQFEPWIGQLLEHLH